MSVRITHDQPPGLTPDERANVQHAYCSETDPGSFAMVFDPGDSTEPTLVAHAVEMITGLLYLRGWCEQTTDVLIAAANGWSGRWWHHPRGPRAFVVQTPIEPRNTPRTDELDTIVELITLA